jgi:hypothetical protein
VQVLDDDTIDLNAGSTNRLEFRQAIPYNRQLICISEDEQYALRAQDEAFSPRSASFVRSASIRTSTILKPLKNQLSWIVVEEAAQGPRFLEMYPNQDEDPNLARADHLNLQVPSYVPPSIRSTAIDSDAGWLASVSDQDPKAMYLWKWVDQGKQRVQSAWFKFTLPWDIEHIYVQRDWLYAVCRKASDVILARIRLSNNNPNGRIEFDGDYYDPRLDLIDYTLATSYNAVTDLTSINVSGTIYDDAQNIPSVFVLDGPNKWTEYRPTYNAGTLTIPGNVGTTDAALGYPYEAVALLPHIYLRTDANQVAIADPPKVRRISIRGFRTGAFRVELQVPGRNLFVQECAFKTQDNYTLGALAMYRVAECTVPMLCDGDRMDLRVIAPHPVPTSVQEITWKGTYANKGLRNQ